MRSLLSIVLFALLFTACKKGVEPQTRSNMPEPPATPSDSSLSVNVNSIHLSASSLSETASFGVAYIGDWSILIDPTDTAWLKVSPLSGTGVTNVTVKARNLNFNAAKRLVVLTVTANGVPRQNCNG